MYNSIFLFLNMGTPEIMIIMFVVLLLFGGKKIPELARGLGKGIREFKDASDGVKREIHNSINNVTESVNVDVSAKTADFSNNQTSTSDFTASGGTNLDKQASTGDVTASGGINLDKKASTGDVTVPENVKTEV